MRDVSTTSRHKCFRLSWLRGSAFSRTDFYVLWNCKKTCRIPKGSLGESYGTCCNLKLSPEKNRLLQNRSQQQLHTFGRLATSALSLHSNGHFPGRPRLAGTRMSPFWILLELRVMELVVTTGAITLAKLQSNHCQQTNTRRFTGRMPFLSPNQECQSIEWKWTSYIMYGITSFIMVY